MFNVVPWLSTIPGIIAGAFLTKRLQSDGWTVGQTRKIVEAICMITEAVCLLLIGKSLQNISCCYNKLMEIKPESIPFGIMENYRLEGLVHPKVITFDC